MTAMVLNSVVRSRTPCAARSKRSSGKLSSTSAARVTARSTKPPRYPASTPKRRPIDTWTAAAAVQVSIGLLLGVLAGYLGGFVDLAVTRAAEVLLSFPLLLLLLAAQGVLDRTTLLSTMAVIALTRWADTSRLVRAEALRVREMPYVEASRALGSSRLRTLLVHVLPNCLSPALVAA